MNQSQLVPCLRVMLTTVSIAMFVNTMGHCDTNRHAGADLKGHDSTLRLCDMFSSERIPKGCIPEMLQFMAAVSEQEGYRGCPGECVSFEVVDPLEGEAYIKAGVRRIGMEEADPLSGDTPIDGEFFGPVIRFHMNCEPRKALLYETTGPCREKEGPDVTSIRAEFGEMLVSILRTRGKKARWKAFVTVEVDPETGEIRNTWTPSLLGNGDFPDNELVDSIPQWLRGSVVFEAVTRRHGSTSIGWILSMSVSTYWNREGEAVAMVTSLGGPHTSTWCFRPSSNVESGEYEWVSIGKDVWAMCQ